MNSGKDWRQSQPVRFAPLCDNHDTHTHKQQVRNAASWAGGLMLFKQYPDFPSDVNLVRAYDSFASSFTSKHTPTQMHRSLSSPFPPPAL